jgi:hypothetical protein
MSKVCIPKRSISQNQAGDASPAIENYVFGTKTSQSLPVDVTGFGLVAGDFNRVGKIDFATPDNGHGKLEVFLNASQPQPFTLRLWIAGIGYIGDKGH